MSQAACRSLGRQPFRKKRREPAWARLIAKVYEADPFVCAWCGSEMRLIEVITDPAEVRTILRHLLTIGRAPPGLDASALN